MADEPDRTVFFPTPSLPTPTVPLRLAIIGLLFALPPAHAQGTVMLAGGGGEGNVGNTASWSYRAYRALVDNGDVDGDGTVRIAVVARDTETEFIPTYFEWIGATLGVSVDAYNVTVGSRAAADDPAIVGSVAMADAVFLKGGDQGQYYDLWNETLLETNVRAVAAAGGALGGTSAGAMSLAGTCLCGGQDLIGSDVMADARSPILDDATAPGTSSLHADFFGTLPGVYVDTHDTARGRLGRLLGVLAKATDDSGDDGLLAVGIDERTALVIRRDTALVVGQGAVEFVHQSPDTQRLRDAGRPLVYTDLRLDRLTDGWRYVVSARAPVTSPLPPGTEPVAASANGTPNAGALTVYGGLPSNEQKFEWVAATAPAPYALTQTTLSTFVRDAVAFTNIDRSDDHRGDRQETLFRALYDRPNLSGVLLYGAYTGGGTTGGQLVRTATEPDVAMFAGDMAGIVVDGLPASFHGQAPTVSAYGIPATALVGARIHVLAESAARGIAFDTRTHTLVGAAVAAEAPPASPRATLEVHPNPAAARAVVHLGGMAGHVRLELLDALGRRVALLVDGPAGEALAVPLDTSRLPSGVYAVRATGTAASVTRRLVVAH